MKLRTTRYDVMWCVALLFAADLIYHLMSLMPLLERRVPAVVGQIIAVTIIAIMFAAIGAGFGALAQRKVLGAIVGFTVIGLLLLLQAIPAPHR